MMSKSASTRAALVACVLLLVAVSCVVAEDDQARSTSRKLLQLQRPWLRLPAYEQINPFRVAAAVSRQFANRISYGFLDDFGADFFDSSFDLLQASIGDIGTSLGLGE